jgi:hypothetical protein
MSRYSYCLLKDSSRVYVITKRHRSDNSEIMRRMIYTEPYKNSWTGIINNEIVGYSNKRLCEEKISKLLLHDDGTIIMSECDLMYMKGVCARLNMPLRVITNIYCDMETKDEHENIYYYILRDDNEYKKR